MSHVRSSIVRRVEEYVRKLRFVDGTILFDRVTELSGPLVEERRSGASHLLSRLIRSLVNLPQYSAIVEFDVRKYAAVLAGYLEEFRRSLETSMMFSSLLAGMLTTVAMLVIVVMRGAP